MEIVTLLKIFHLLGLIAGFGGALYADYILVMQGVLTELDEQTIRQVTHLSRIVIIGLIILWVSGLILAFVVYLDNPHFIENEKFWAKIMIVIALCLNGFFIHSLVLPAMRNTIGKRLLFDTDFPLTIALTFCGCVSLTSWFIPFILGSAPEFSYVVPFGFIVLIWMITTLLSLMSMIFMIFLIKEY